ncbi:MAG: ZIP family metal transporter [Deltaproteobacteria bacterium]|nr:ZIP family metal transporter [Deltaproteobacteria bacterium]
MSIFQIALIMGLVTAFGNILGSVLAVLRYRPSHSFTAAALGFSGGFVLAAALLEMVPESMGRGASMPAFVALGYLLVFLLEQSFNVHLHRLPDEHNTSLIHAATGLASLIAFNTHDFIDGLAIGSAMVTETRLGVVVSLAVLFHEIPAGFVIAAIMREAGWSCSAAILAGVSLGLITILGIALPFWAGEISPFLTDALLAVAAGTFIYLGATLLVPLSEAGKSRWITLLVLLGFAVFFLTSWFVKLFLTGC